MTAVTYRYRDGICKLDLNLVRYFKADNKYVDAYLYDGTVVLLTESLSALNCIVEPDTFFRVHRSYLVRIGLMYRIDKVPNLKNVKGVFLDGVQSIIPVGRRQAAEVRRLVKK